MICPTYSHRSFLPRNHRLYNADGHMLCSEKKNCTLEIIGKFKFEEFKSGTSLVVQEPLVQKQERWHLILLTH